MPTSPWDCGVVKDGEIVVGAGVALLQVEGHPSELDDVPGGRHDHPTTVHSVRILLRLQCNGVVTKFKSQIQCFGSILQEEL